jgi:hypothetical protein
MFTEVYNILEPTLWIIIEQLVISLFCAKFWTKATSYKVRTLLSHKRSFFKGKLLAILEMVLKAFCHSVTQIFFYG